MAETVIVRGNTYEVEEMASPRSNGQGDAVFYDTHGNNVQPSDVRANVRYTGATGGGVGTMVDNGTVDATISTKAQVVTIPEGIHSGSGTVQIAPAEQQKIVAGNIRAGVSILGQNGKSTVVDTEITANAAAAANIDQGYKAVVNGVLLTGENVPVTVSYDSATKVLRIS